jgi:hypothetical protein
LSCFAVGLSLSLFTRGLCLCLTPFPWGKGKVSDPSAGCHYQHVVMISCLFLNVAELFNCGCPGTEPCSLLPLLLPYFRPTCSQPSCHLFTDGSCEFCSLPLPPSPVHFQQPPSPLLCSKFQFHCLLFSVLFCFLWGGSVCPGGSCWFIPGVAEGYHVMLGAHLFGLPKVSQACLELVATGGDSNGSSGMGMVAHLFSQCIVAWRSLPQARSSGYQSFNSPLCFTFAKCGFSVSASSLIYGAHAVHICAPVTILDPRPRK